MRYANETEIKQAEVENPVVYGDRMASIPTLKWETSGSDRAIKRRVEGRLLEAAQAIARQNEQIRFDQAAIKKCPRCKGTGYYGKQSADSICFKCGGKGVVYKSGEVSNWQKLNR